MKRLGYVLSGAMVLALSLSVAIVAPAAAAAARSVATEGREEGSDRVLDGTWAQVGPNGAGGVIAQTPDDPEFGVLVQESKRGLWVTEDSGRTWVENNRMPAGTAHYRGHVVIDPSDADRWWYATNQYADPILNGTLLMTEDRGQSWRVLDVPQENLMGLSVSQAGSLLSLVSSNEVAGDGDAVSPTHVSVSRDRGESWVRMALDAPGDLHEARVVDGSVILKDAWHLWRQDGLGDGTLSPARELLDVSGEERHQILSIGAEGDVLTAHVIGRGVVGSVDGGATWEDIIEDTDYGPEGRGAISSTEIHNGVIYVRTLTEPQRMLVSHDLGESFDSMPLPAHSDAFTHVNVWHDGSVTMSSPWAGVYRTTDDGQHYERVGVPGTMVYGLAVSGPQILAATMQEVYRSTVPPRSTEWGQNGAEGTIGNTIKRIEVSPDNEESVWRTRETAFGNLYIQHSDDGGVTWVTRGEDFGGATALMVHPLDPNYVAVAYEQGAAFGVVLTRDGGESWTTIGTPVAIHALTGDPTSAERMWFGTDDGLYFTEDAMATGEQVLDARVTAIYADQRVLITGGNQIFRSADGGTTFTEATNSMDVATTSVTDFIRVGQRLFASSTSGSAPDGVAVQVSSDGGRRWADISNGLPNREVLSLAAAPDELTIYAGIEWGGVQAVELLPFENLELAPDRVETEQGIPVTADVLANDGGGEAGISVDSLAIDCNGAGLESCEIPDVGTYTTSGPPGSKQVTFAPERGFVGETSVTYGVESLSGESESSQLVVTVTPSVLPTDPGSGAVSPEGPGTSDGLATAGVHGLWLWIAGAIAVILLGASAMAAGRRKWTPLKARRR